MRLAQHIHLRLGQTQTAEHATMGGDKVKAIRIGRPTQRIGQCLPQGQHVQPHHFQLGLPIGAQAVILKDHRHQPRAVIGREAIVLPVQKREIALHHRLAVGAGQGDQHTRPLTVDAKVL